MLNLADCLRIKAGSVILLVFGWLFWVSPAIAGEIESDLEKAYREVNTTNGLERLKNLYFIADQISCNDPALVKRHIHLITTENKDQHPAGMYYIYKLKSNEYKCVQNYSKAIALLDTAIYWAKKQSNNSITFNAFMSLGDCYKWNSRYAEAYKAFNKAADYLGEESLANCMDWFGLYREIGDLNLQLNNNSHARTSYLKAKRIIDVYKPQERGLRINIVNNIGLSYLEELDYPNGLLWFKKAKAEAIKDVKKYEEIHGVISGNIGYIYVQQKRYRAAIPYLAIDTASSCRHNNANSYFLAKAELVKANLYSGNHKIAVKLADQIINDAWMLKVNQTNRILIYRTVFKVFAEVGRTSEAIALADSCMSMSNTLVLSQYKEMLNGLEATFTLRSKELELQTNKKIILANEAAVKELTRQRSFLAMAILAFLVGGFVFWFNYRQKTQLAEALALQSSELESANQQLAKVVAKKTSILGVVSHDLKSPINRVSGLLDLMKYDPDNAETYNNMLEVSIHDANALIKNLLDDSAIDEGNRKVNPSTFDVVRLGKELTTAIAPSLKYKKIQLHIETNLPDISIYSDKHLLTRCVENLLSNAIKFSPQESTVTLAFRTEPDDDKVTISIIDQGPGISKEDQAKIFMPYTRGAAIPTAGESSTGLGLSIVQRILSTLQGTISIQSTPGMGTTFSLSIPKNLQA